MIKKLIAYREKSKKKRSYVWTHVIERRISRENKKQLAFYAEQLIAARHNLNSRITIFIIESQSFYIIYINKKNKNVDR